METFPTMGSWLADASVKDGREGTPTQASRFYAGYTQRVNRFSWVPKTFRRTLANLTLTNRGTLQTFESTVKYGQDAFNWTDDILSTVFQVRIASGPMMFSMWAGRNDLWQVPLTLVQTTPAELATSATKEGVMQYTVEDLAVGADITARPIMSRAYAYTFSKATILTEGTPAGIDDANTCVVALKNGAGSTIVTKTYNTATQPPTSDYGDLGTLSITSIVAGDIITLTVTQGATANLPPFSIILE